MAQLKVAKHVFVSGFWRQRKGPRIPSGSDLERREEEEEESDIGS